MFISHTKLGFTDTKQSHTVHHCVFQNTEGQESSNLFRPHKQGLRALKGNEAERGYHIQHQQQAQTKAHRYRANTTFHAQASVATGHRKSKTQAKSVCRLFFIPPCHFVGSTAGTSHTAGTSRDDKRDNGFDYGRAWHQERAEERLEITGSSHRPSKSKHGSKRLGGSPQGPLRRRHALASQGC